MAFQAALAPVMVLCGVVLYGFDALLATGEYFPDKIMARLITAHWGLEPS